MRGRIVIDGNDFRKFEGKDFKYKWSWVWKTERWDCNVGRMESGDSVPQTPWDLSLLACTGRG
jgi:hypothetical protein